MPVQASRQPFGHLCVHNLSGYSRICAHKCPQASRFLTVNHFLEDAGVGLTRAVCDHVVFSLQQTPANKDMQQRFDFQ